MIETTQAYKVGEKTFGTVTEAQAAALALLLLPDKTPTDAEHALLSSVVSQAASVVAILVMREPKEKTRKPRSDQGKPHRKKKAEVVAESAPIESTVEGSGKYSGK